MRNILVNLFLEETGVPVRNRENLTQINEKLYHIRLYRVNLTVTGYCTHIFGGKNHPFH